MAKCKSAWERALANCTSHQPSRLVLQPVFCLLDLVQQAEQFCGWGRGVGPFDLPHVLLRKVRLEKGAHVELFPPAIENQPAGLTARFPPAIAEVDLVSEAAAAQQEVLIVVGQHDPDQQVPTPSDLPETVALATGRPTLVVPHIGAQKSLGKTILLCWNASRESARAASDALPLLSAAEKVVVLVIDPRSSPTGHGAEPGADVAAWLARHGVKVTVQRDVAADTDVGSVILSRAADHDADLIVMGIYGHSRMREMVLGGASRTLMASMTVPVLMAH